jgi:hypothetical protein
VAGAERERRTHCLLLVGRWARLNTFREHVKFILNS